jgi:hypothetical protein
MRLHSLAAAVAAATLAVAPAAGAVARKPPICKQLTDADNDSKAFFVVGDSPSLEIVSADLATGRRNLVAVLRMKSVERDRMTTAGLTYSWRFTVGGKAQELVYYLYNNGQGEAFYDLDRTNGQSQDAIPVTGVIDPKTSSVVWTVPRKAVPALGKAGAKFTELSAMVKVGNNIWTSSGLMHGSSGSGDLVDTTRTYTDLTPTCLKGV